MATTSWFERMGIAALLAGGVCLLCACPFGADEPALDSGAGAAWAGPTGEEGAAWAGPTGENSAGSGSRDVSWGRDVTWDSAEPEDKAGCTHIQYCSDPRLGGGITCYVDRWNCDHNIADECRSDAWYVCGPRHYDRVCDSTACPVVRPCPGCN